MLVARQARRKRLGVATLGIAVIVVFSAVWNPPTGSVHAFSKGSDYKAARESGCTNSGKGCHGSERDYADFNTYHKDASCTDCHDYQGVGCIPCHHGDQNECERCHDGTVRNAPDVIGLTESWPHGHYRETTHTAMGTEFDAEVRTSASGAAHATCEDCHSRDLRKAHTDVKPVKGSPYGRDLGCGGCHNDERTPALSQVLSKWKSRRCEDCHSKPSSAPMHPSDVAASVPASASAGCASSGKGCHESSDLHAMHADAPVTCSGAAAKGEPGCHSVKAEAYVPIAKGCGEASAGCHRSYRAGKLGHEHDAEVHSPEGDAVASDTSYHGIACGRCHWMADDGRSLVTEHARPTSKKTNVAGDVCRDCHNDPASQAALRQEWPERDGTDACDACHGTKGLPKDHPADLGASHAVSSPGCSSTGPGCHPSDDLSQVGTPTVSANIHRDCVRCHDRTAADGNAAYDPSRKTCGSGRDCHGDGREYDPATSVHAGSKGRVDGTDPAHTTGRAQGRAELKDAASGLETQCSACHEMSLVPEHTRSSSSLAKGTGNVCVRCHDADAVTAGVVKAGWDDADGAEACAVCHKAGSARGPHERIGAVHEDTQLRPDGSISATACVGAGCHSTTDVRVLHARLGCTVAGCHTSKRDIRGADIRSCGGLDRRTSCHVGYAAKAGHRDMSEVHEAVELSANGTAEKGACSRAGCHTSLDLIRLHDDKGCMIEGCHEAGTTPGVRSCGGRKGGTPCHDGFSEAEHFVSHRADRSGTVDGVTYGPGANVGCFGCHSADLREEHTGTTDSGMTGGGVSNCRVCHDDPDDPGNGRYAGLAKVRGSVEAHDLRCLACHASGSDEPGHGAAASAHKKRTDAARPVGAVWSDPAEEWRAAFDAPTGGGHNVLPSEVVGGTIERLFPVTRYTVGGSTYTWSLPSNSGATRWLRSDVFGDRADSAEAIRHITILCSDCHSIPEEMAGPHGAAVQVGIDPAYSQTEYADPTRGTSSQFEATGTRRVVCFKCHDLFAGSIEGTEAPGGSPVHGQHAEHPGFPSYNPVRYGEKCIDCHVRIPHAWRHQRLLIRTVETSDGVPADTYPYVQSGHDGLRGVLLGDIDGGSGPAPSSCVTGGCHGRHGTASHPSASDVPTSAYWP